MDCGEQVTLVHVLMDEVDNGTEEVHNVPQWASLQHRDCSQTSDPLAPELLYRNVLVSSTCGPDNRMAAELIEALFRLFPEKAV
jgi:hypothetical protein